MEQLLIQLEDLDIAINSTIDIKGLRALLGKQQQVHEEFIEIKHNFEDENYQFHKEKYHTVLILKEKCDLLIQDLKMIFNVSSANVSSFSKLVTSPNYSGNFLNKIFSIFGLAFGLSKLRRSQHGN